MDTAATDDKLSIEVKKAAPTEGKSDMDLLTDIADMQYRTPAQQAAAFVHAALVTERNRANAPDKPAKLGRGARDKAA